MKNRIHYSPESLRDLDKIWEYIAEESSIEVAENVVNQIFGSIDKLEEFSEIGTVLYAIINVSNEYRFLISGQYLIFYRTKNHDVFVDRILHCKQDYLRVLFGKS